jgi:hypothetical protein
MWKKEYEMINPGSPSPYVSVDVFTLSDAQKRATADRTGGYSDWRLPNIKELRSLVDETQHNPAIDPIFPELLPASGFWSSTPAQNFSFYPDLSWMVQFDNGVPINIYPRPGAKHSIRFVRDVDEPVYCTGDIPSGTVVSAAIPTVSRPWTYSISEESCTFRCESGLIWDGSSCGAQTAQVYHKLNDTGADECGNLSSKDISLCPTYESDSSDYPRQDANI